MELLVLTNLRWKRVIPTMKLVVTASRFHPANCVVSNGTGTIAEENMETVEVVCTDNTFRVGGLLSGLAGEGLLLSLNDRRELRPCQEWGCDV